MQCPLKHVDHAALGLTDFRQNTGGARRIFHNASNEPRVCGQGVKRNLLRRILVPSVSNEVGFSSDGQGVSLWRR